jgi:prepilin-type N-terminal cleavage/methylation domain-containing protein
MRSLETNAKHRESRTRGFSLLEMMIVLALLLIVTKITFISLMPVLKQQHVTNAYNTTLSAMRQARDNAVSQRTSYSVTFSSAASPNTIVVAPTLLGFVGDQNTVTYKLPPDVPFNVQPGFPTPGPDKFGTGTTAIDFGYTSNGGAGGGATIFFCPDGSAQTAACSAGGYANDWDGGVVYMGLPGNVLSSRALTLSGGTGRIHGWRLVNSGGYKWLRQ